MKTLQEEQLEHYNRENTTARLTSYVMLGFILFPVIVAGFIWIAG